jgi:hypothetical protein
LKLDHTVLQVDDSEQGPGFSRQPEGSKPDRETCTEIEKLAQFLFRMVNITNRRISLSWVLRFGITTAYLASANGNESVHH